MEGYGVNLVRFQRSAAIDRTEEATSLVIQRYLSGLRELMKPVSVHCQVSSRCSCAPAD